MARPLSGLRVAVAGAGVLGLGVAALAARRGAEVVVFDPAVLGDNASGVAAGMLSPVLETVLEDGDVARYALFRRAYEAWPAFAASLGVSLEGYDAGALQTGDVAAVAALAAKLQALGVEAHPLGPADVRDRQPLYGGAQAGLFVAGDGRLHPGPALAALAGAVDAASGRRVAERLDSNAPPEGFDRLVVATGFDARAGVAVAPELAALSPIKGHILHYALAGQGGATLRGDGGYLAPHAGGVVFGATMEPRRDDRTVDATIAAELHRRAVALAPGLDGVARVARAGVRAATPDGLPLVGASASGAILAVGARRNGWLLAPLIAEAAVAALQGEPPWPVFDPARFGPA